MRIVRVTGVAIHLFTFTLIAIQKENKKKKKTKSSSFNSFAGITTNDCSRRWSTHTHTNKRTHNG